MKGLIRKTAAVVAVAAGAAGCYEYRDVVDPCYPLRYSWMARQEVNTACTPQVQNGQVLDQTVWNSYFEPGSDRLTPLGLDRLAYLARRRPQPDPNLFLQTAQDLVYDPALPEKMAEARQDLDEKRKAAVQRFLVQQTAGHPVPFNITVHDPAEVGQSAIPAGSSVVQMYARARGGLQSGGGSVAGGAGTGVQGAASGIGAGTGR
jgi:hypothetical protein